jgi:hypothetical protein
MPDTPPPFRVYTCYIDAILQTHTLPHGDLPQADLERELNREFHAWLEMTAPGALEAGRVTGIRFADFTDGDAVHISNFA